MCIDLIAVLCPFGPLKMLIDSTKTQSKNVPALLYAVNAVWLMAFDERDYGSHTGQQSQQSSQQQTQHTTHLEENTEHIALETRLESSTGQQQLPKSSSTSQPNKPADHSTEDDMDPEEEGK
jgi:hypothetical protein